MDTFRQHHEIVNHGNADERVYPDEFVDYCAHVSSSIDSDAYFELMMSNSWGLNAAQGGGLPFAGSARKITQVNAREAYRADHHRNLFGTDSKTPFDKTPQTEWQSSQNSTYLIPEIEVVNNKPMAGGSHLARSQAEDPNMKWAQSS